MAPHIIALACALSAACGRYGFDAECAQPSLVTDDFDGNEVSSPWIPWQDADVTVAVSGGVLTITPQANTVAYGGIVSLHYFDLRGQRTFVEVVQATNPATTAQTFLQIIAPYEQRLEIVAEAGTLLFRSVQDGVIDERGRVTYDPAQHRFWQIREADGTAHFETSADGRDFTSQTSIGAPFDLSLVRQQLGAGTWQSEAEPGVAVFDRHNGGGRPTGRWCPIGNLHDDFSDGVRAPIWARWFGPDGCSVETGGQLELTAPTDVNDYCGYGSARPFDLRGGAVAAELVSGTPVGSPSLTVLELRDDATGLRQQFIQQGDQLIMRVPGQPDLAVTGYDASAHRYLRFADQGDAIAWQVSPDGTLWTTLYVGPAAVDRAAVSVLIGVNQFDTGTAPPPVRWDNVGP